MNEQTIELKMKATAQEAKANIDKLVKSLFNIENVITNIYLELGNIEKKSESSINKTTKAVNNLKTSTDKANDSASKLGNTFKNLFTFASAKKFTMEALSGLKSSMDYSEALNLFNVVFKNAEKDGKTMFSNLGREATQFQNKLNEAFGTNKEQTLTYQSLYQSMAENMGIATDKAGVMSENTTKLINDLSSLYNKSEKSVSTALSSGIYAGQVRPLRTYGIDITEKSLQPVLDSLGIEKTVRELSQAEKQILRYIAVVRQSSVAHADWAQTIESPSNQLKILSNQAKEAKTYLSSLFIGTFANILPYANAFLMVVKEVSKAIADMFGIELKDYNSGIASSEDAFVDLGDSVDDATGKVKELKRQVLGFDQIHNINENKDSDSSSLVGGIDQRLLDAIHGYDNGMDKVRMKATEIRDRIMEWLGFTKEIDPLTGEVGFKFLNTESTLYKIITALKNIYDYGKKIVGEVLSQIMSDLNSGLFGDIIVTILEGIGNALKWISENESAVKTISKLVECLIIWKGLKLTANVLGLPSIIDGIGSMWGKLGDTSSAKKATDALENMSTKGRKSIWNLLNSEVDGVTALKLGLVALTEARYIIQLGVDGYNETEKAIKTVTDVSGQMRDTTQEVVDKFIDAQNTMDKTSDEYKKLSDGVISTTEWLKKQNGTIEQSKNWFTNLSWQTEKYNIQQRENQRAIDNSTNSMAKMVYQGDITIEMFETFANKVGYSSEQVNALKEKIIDSNTNLSDFDNFVQNFKTDKMKEGFNELKGSIDNSVLTVDTLKNQINNMQSKNITLNINADMSQAERSTVNFITRFATNFSTKIANVVSGIGFRQNGGIYSNGTWKNIPQYANGGMPSHGSMFIAGERGAEIVGHINGKTEVLNQSQIASAIYNAVVSAMSQFSGQASQVDVRVHSDGSVVVDEINQVTRQTGVCPIDIPMY